MVDFIIEAQLRCRVSFHQLIALLICALATVYASNMWSDCVAFLGMRDKCTKMFDDFRDGVLILGCRSGMLLFTTQDLCWQGPSKLPLNQHKQWGGHSASFTQQHPANPLEQI